MAGLRPFPRALVVFGTGMGMGIGHEARVSERWDLLRVGLYAGSVVWVGLRAVVRFFRMARVSFSNSELMYLWAWWEVTVRRASMAAVFVGVVVVAVVIGRWWVGGGGCICGLVVI